MHQRSFEVVPTSGTPFEPFVMDFNVLTDSDDDHERSARRAYFQAFHILGPRGLEPEDFQVFEFDGDSRGREVGPKGLASWESH